MLYAKVFWITLKSHFTTLEIKKKNQFCHLKFNGENENIANIFIYISPFHTQFC